MMKFDKKYKISIPNFLIAMTELHHSSGTKLRLHEVFLRKVALNHGFLLLSSLLAKFCNRQINHTYQSGAGTRKIGTENN